MNDKFTLYDEKKIFVVPIRFAKTLKYAIFVTLTKS